MDSSSQSLGRHLLRTVGFFQAFCALPITLILGFLAFSELFGPHMYFYDFFTDSITALMAAGIIFIVIVQRKVSSTDLLTLQFEVAKSILATGLWLWLMLDSAFGPWKRRQYRDPSREVPRRVARATTAAILLLVLFYPALIYSYLSWKNELQEEMESREAGTGTERTPLLLEHDTDVP